ncbi:GNAT family N-acetyltransferase [Pseudomonas aeruginosa]
MDDLSALVELENRCFDYDRLSRRNFQWMLTRAHASLTVAEGDGGVLGYALVLFHEGTSLARLYSIAIDPRARGIGLGQKLLEAAEQAARDNDRAYMRLEVRPTTVAPSPSTSATATVPCHRARLLRGPQRSAALRETHPQPRPRTAPPRALLPGRPPISPAARPACPDGHGRAATGSAS